jgi:hypothetical protein
VSFSNDEDGDGLAALFGGVTPQAEPGPRRGAVPPAEPDQAPPDGTAAAPQYPGLDPVPAAPEAAPPAYRPPEYPAPTAQPPAAPPPSYQQPAYEPPSYQQPAYEPPTYEPPVSARQSFAPPTFPPPADEVPAPAASQAPPSYDLPPPAYEPPPAHEPPAYEPPPSSYEPPAYEPPPSFAPPTYDRPASEPPSYDLPPPASAPAAFSSPVPTSYDLPAPQGATYSAPPPAAPPNPETSQYPGSPAVPTAFPPPSPQVTEPPTGYEAPIQEPLSYPRPSYDPPSYAPPAQPVPSGFETLAPPVESGDLATGTASPGSPESFAAPALAEPPRADTSERSYAEHPLVRPEPAVPATVFPAGPLLPSSQAAVETPEDLERSTIAEKLGLVLALLTGPIGLAVAIVNAVRSGRRRGWLIGVVRASLVLGVLSTIAAGIAGYTYWNIRADQIQHAETAAASAEFCAAAEADPTMVTPPTLGWPAPAASVGESIVLMQAWTDRWTALAATAPPGLKSGIELLAEKGQTIVDAVTQARTVDDAANQAQIAGVEAQAGVASWYSTYCLEP